MSVVGLIGILVFLMGMHLLWQARREIFFWLEEFVRILRREVTTRAGLGEQAAVTPPSEVAAAGGASRRGRGTLRMLGGLALLFIGPLLLILDLVL